MADKQVPFQERFHEEMIDGRKQCTARVRPVGSAGDTFEAFGATFEIRAVVRHSLDDVRNFLWRMEGVESPEEFEAVWEGLHPRAGFRPKQLVYVHFFFMTTAPGGPDIRAVYAAQRINSLMKTNGEVALLYVQAVDEAEALLKQVQDIWDALHWTGDVVLRQVFTKDDGAKYTIKPAFDKLTPILPLREDRPDVQPLLALVKWWRDDKDRVSRPKDAEITWVPVSLLDELQVSIEGERDA